MPRQPTLLPALGTHQDASFVPLVPTAQIPSWTIFSPGTVIWKVWPAVLAQTVFSAVIVYLAEYTWLDLSIDNVMLTVMGVVIGFVISYRASSGYDRYWAGRSAWATLICNCRTASRLIWYHVPPRLSQAKPGDMTLGPKAEVPIALEEKKIAMSLIEGFAVALKHHLRGEMGVYYEDLYYLVGSVPHPVINHSDLVAPPTAINSTTALPDVSALPSGDTAAPMRSFDPKMTTLTSLANGADQTGQRAYAHLDHTHNGIPHRMTLVPDRPLLPSRSRRQTTWSTELIPFAFFFSFLLDLILCREFESRHEKEVRKGVRAAKHRPIVAGGGDNIPLEICGALSEYLATLDARQTMNGNASGGLYGCLSSFEATLTETEKILTTPLPYCYAVHLRTVWLYLFFLPFQLAKTFGWLTILGVFCASFFYLGFLAAGDELEQPFGFDHNDLDLDLFCHIIHGDLANLINSETPYSYLALNAAKIPQGRIADSAAKAPDADVGIGVRH